MESGIFDSHAHYDDRRFDDDRTELLDGLFRSGKLFAAVNCGCDIASSESSLRLAEAYEGVYAAVGIHPHEAEDATEDDYLRLEELCSHKKAVAIGEIGLDYHYDFSPREKQKEAFIRQMELAERLGMPVVIHDREAHKDCVDIATSFKGVTGVLHSFSGSAETAKILQKAGWYISFSGVVTFKNAKQAALAVEAVANDRLLVETDCPYLTPHPHRGERNHSGYVEHIIAKIAEIRSESYEFIETLTRENAKRFFGIERAATR